MIKIRYLFGIPFLFVVGYFGGNILTTSMIIGVLAWFTDIIIDDESK